MTGRAGCTVVNESKSCAPALARSPRPAELRLIGSALRIVCAIRGALGSYPPLSWGFDFTLENRRLGDLKDPQNVRDLLPGEPTAGTAGHGSAPIGRARGSQTSGVTIAEKALRSDPT
jgi:hypothetical protein